MNAVIVEPAAREGTRPALWRPSMGLPWEGMVIPTAVRRVPVTDDEAASADRLVFALKSLSPGDSAQVGRLGEMIGGAQRRGQEVYLVRCSAEIHRKWRSVGLSRTSRHVASVAAATRGLVGEMGGYGELSFAGGADQVQRVLEVLDVVLRRARLGPSRQEEARAALSAALDNAVVHGCPQGTRQHVWVSFSLEPDALLVDVEDRGPGMEAAEGAQGRSGRGLGAIQAGADHVEYFSLEPGTLVRMTWSRSGPGRN